MLKFGAETVFFNFLCKFATSFDGSFTGMKVDSLSLSEVDDTRVFLEEFSI
jgi:hypothetical protein